MAIKIAIIGIGGVGGFLAGELARFYHHSTDVEIYFISRGAMLQVICEKGLTIHTLDSTYVCYPKLATQQASEIGPVDYLFCTTKSYDAEQAIREAMPCIQPHTVIIPIMNGVFGAEKIRELLPQQEVWWGCVYVYAKIEAPGIIYENTNGYTYMYGSPTASPERIETLDRIFQKAGINALSKKDILTKIWTKFAFVSPIASITSYTRKNCGEVLQDPELRRIYCDLIEEFCKVARHKGVILDDDVADQIVKGMEHFPPETTTSMQRDFQRHHKSELNALVGYVVREAQLLHLNVPHYQKIYETLAAQSI